MEKQIKDIVAYCQGRCDEWDDMVSVALGYLGRHEPVPYWIRTKIEDLVSEWCNENDVSLDFFEDVDKMVEDVIYGNAV